MKTITYGLMLIFSLRAITSFAQPGSLDSSFNNDGKAATTSSGFYDEGFCVAIQPDGKIIVAGGSQKKRYYQLDFGLVRYTNSGMQDSSFGKNGFVTTDISFGKQDYASAVAIQSDGKIIAAGTTYNNTNYDFAAARYNSNGSLDNSFANNGKLTADFGNIDDYASSLLLLPDGKILLAGTSRFDFALARYKKNGFADNSFGTGGKVTTHITDYARAYAAALRKNGKIILAGTTYNGFSYDFALVQYLENGTVDSSFGNNGKVITAFGSEAEAHAITLLDDGKMLVAGYVYTGTNFDKYDFALLRYNKNGSPDSSFGNNGKVITSIQKDDGAASVLVQADGKILAAGYSDGNFALVRYKPNGALDKTFGTKGKVITTGFDSSFISCYARGAALQADGKIVLAGFVRRGSFPQAKIAVARYNGDSVLNNNWLAIANNH